jgi:hypothetical protein
MAEPVYVYCCFPDFVLPEGLPALFTFREIEGLTAVLVLQDADQHALSYTFKARLITLKVHSSLEAVGFLAVVSVRLARAGIPCNAIAGYYHDHILVPIDRAVEAFSVLKEIREAHR